MKPVSVAVLLVVAVLAVAGVAQAFVVPTFGDDDNVDNLKLSKGRNGGYGCLACSFVVALVEQMVEFRNSTAVETLDKFCQLFPKEFEMPCTQTLAYLGPSVIKLIIHKNGPDVICHALNLCFTEPEAPTCKTISPPSENTKIPFELRVARAKALIRDDEGMKAIEGITKICDVPGIKLICKLVNGIFTDHNPVLDLDKDGYSAGMTYRGSGWSGKDCSDLFKNMHPGAIPTDKDMFFDTNCNGIHGLDVASLQSYEDELCSQSQPRGVAVLGDSIGAHCSIPSVWLDATKISIDALKELVFVIKDELDWPMLGSYTGHGTNKWKDVIEGPVDSIYQRLVARNRCNHRDYQNLAVNGGDSFNIHNAMVRLHREQSGDHPLVVFVVLVGNDICQGKSQSIDNMTTPEEMYQNTLITLAHLEKSLPAGSSVLIQGLADGRVLYENLYDRIHPVGNYWQRFTYGEFYDFLNCLKISPCPTWLNSNETERERGAKRVTELNKVLKDMATNDKAKYSNFKLYFLDDPVAKVIKQWVSEGGEPWELVELADGFHSNTMAQSLTAKVLWEDIAANFPEVLGPVNPNNEMIQNVFGDQGGL